MLFVSHLPFFYPPIYPPHLPQLNPLHPTFTQTTVADVTEDGTGASIADLETALAKAQKKGVDAAIIGGLEARLAALLQLQPKEGEVATTAVESASVEGESASAEEEKTNMKSSKAEVKAEAKEAKKVGMSDMSGMREGMGETCSLCIL